MTDFIDIIEKECYELDGIIDQSALDALGESLLQTYGDLNQKRNHLHAERLRYLNDSRSPNNRAM